MIKTKTLIKIGKCENFQINISEGEGEKLHEKCENSRKLSSLISLSSLNANSSLICIWQFQFDKD